MALGDLQAKFDRWREIVEQNHPGSHFEAVTGDPWTPLRKPLSACRVALVSTAGIHLRSQAPFDLEDHTGDITYRVIPAETNGSDLMATHSHYDTEAANQDINTVFPIDRMRELADEGIIGSIAPRHFGLMGFIPDGRRVLAHLAPTIARFLVEDEVDLALLTPG